MRFKAFPSCVELLFFTACGSSAAEERSFKLTSSVASTVTVHSIA